MAPSEKYRPTRFDRRSIWYREKNQFGWPISLSRQEQQCIIEFDPIASYKGQVNDYALERAITKKTQHEIERLTTQYFQVLMQLEKNDALLSIAQAEVKIVTSFYEPQREKYSLKIAQLQSEIKRTEDEDRRSKYYEMNHPIKSLVSDGIEKVFDFIGTAARSVSGNERYAQPQSKKPTIDDLSVAIERYKKLQAELCTYIKDQTDKIGYKYPITIGDKTFPSIFVFYSHCHSEQNKTIEQLKRVKRKICNRIEKINEEYDEKKEKDKALAAAYTGKSRSIASTVKSTLHKTKFCPYCGDAIGADPHADHIYPIVRGGLSVAKNMVYICQTCNSKKSDLTLMQFIKKYNLESEKIFERLEALGKEF